MAKKQKVETGIVPMSELISATRGDLLELVSSSFETGRKAYIVAAKCCIALNESLAPNEKLYKVLRAAGLKNSQIANGRQLAQVWETWVQPDGTAKVGEEVVATGGKMTEDFFDEHLNYSLAVALNKLTRKNVTMAESFLGQPEEWDCLAEHGMDTASYEDYQRKQAQAEAEAKRKADEARIQAAAKKMADEAEPADDTEPADDAEPADDTEPADDAEPEDEAEPADDTEPADDAEPEVDTEPEVEDNVTGFPDQKDNMPAFRNGIETVERLAVEIAAYQPEKAEEARQALADLVERLADVFDAAEVDESEVVAATA